MAHLLKPGGAATPAASMVGEGAKKSLRRSATGRVDDEDEDEGPGRKLGTSVESQASTV